MNLRWLQSFQLLILDEVDSTNEEAKRIAASDSSPSHLVIWSRKQTSGKGRYGRQWESEDGNLFMTIILPRTGSIQDMGQLSFVSSLAVEGSIVELATKYNLNVDIKVKWPNDVLVNNKKIAGILLETAGLNNEFIIIGIGVNVSSSPQNLKDKATNLFNEGFYFTEANFMLGFIMTNFVKHYHQWLTNDFRVIRDQWLLKAAKVGENITVQTYQSRVSGEFIDIDFNGAIRIKVASGQICSVYSGEVFFD